MQTLAGVAENRGHERLGVSIVEDDDEIRGHLGLLVSRAPGFQLVGAHARAEEALALIPKAVPDVVLMDIHLPGLNGIECTRALKTQIESLQILMLTVYEDSEKIFESLKAGASGYLLKRTPSPQILEAIREVHQGGSPMSSQIARKVVRYFSEAPSRAPALAGLSPREQEVLDHLAQGLLYKEIAEGLGVSLDTIRKHLQSIYQKLHVHTRTEAVVKYLGKDLPGQELGA